MNDKPDMWYVVERMRDTGGATKDQTRYLTTRGWGDRRDGLTFTKKDGIEVVKNQRVQFRDYCAEYYIELSPTVNLQTSNVDLLNRLIPARTNNISRMDYHYIASFIVDLRHKPDYEIIDRAYLTINGDFDADMYHSECVSNAELSHFLETEITGRLVDAEIVSGMFRLVYGVKCDGSVSSTPDGTEYDAWENYTLLTKTELSEKEMQFMLEENDDFVTLERTEYEDLVEQAHNGGINKIGDGM